MPFQALNSSFIYGYQIILTDYYQNKCMIFNLIFENILQFVPFKNLNKEFIYNLYDLAVYII